MPFLDNRESVGTKGRRLTPKMKSFVDEYMIDGNATEAVLRSDYSTSSKYLANRMASELMAHPLIQDEIAHRQAKRTQRSEVKAEYLLLKLMEIIDSEGEGRERTGDRLRAIELAGKAIALWKERQEVSGPDGEAIKHEQHVKESVADFTSRLSSLAQRAGTCWNYCHPFPQSNWRN
jgi:phage terminase small subunit